MTMENNLQKQYKAKVFVSCSLRPDDKPFVDYVEKILEEHKFEPFGTVGRYSASPENPAVLMKKNIPYADFVVICATPRYLQEDLQTGEISYGLSEMIHIETGIAYAHNKQVVVFVREGTSVGTFIPNITQFITLNETKDDFLAKKHIIYELLNSAYQTAKIVTDKIKNDNDWEVIRYLVLILFAIYGFYKFLQALLTKKPNKRRKQIRQRI